MTTLSELDQLRSEISTLEQRLAQLEEPEPATPLEGLPTAEIMAAVQRTTEAERARQQERQNIGLTLPVLRQRLIQLEKECSALKQELDRKMNSYQKLANKVGSSLDGILAQLEELKALGIETQAIYQKAYGRDTSRSSVWVDNWYPHQFDFPAIAVLRDETGVRVVLTTRALVARYQPRI